MKGAETVRVCSRELDLLNVSLDNEKHAVLGLVLLHQHSINDTTAGNPLLFIERNLLEESD